MVGPQVAKFAADEQGRWLVVKVNTDELQGLAQRLGITAIPLIAVFKASRELARKAGAMPVAGIRQFAEQAAQAGPG